MDGCWGEAGKGCWTPATRICHSRCRVPGNKEARRETRAPYPTPSLPIGPLDPRRGLSLGDTAHCWVGEDRNANLSVNVCETMPGPPKEGRTVSF